ncbi:diaminopimelate epimerase [bacterium]|nr:diaminopimelate epimerase [bacterium]
MKVPFVKLDGAGNDFVGIDWRGKVPLPEDMAGALARLLCNRHHGIGADGVLMVLDPPSPDFHFTMLYLNADGSVGGMCGNGARCIAVFAHHLGAAPTSMRFMTGAGAYTGAIIPGGARIDFPDAPWLPERRTPLGPLRPVEEALFLPMGVPHAVVFVEDLDLVDVAQLGREMRHDPAFAPAGTNMNFAQMVGDRLHVRTYERGVEEETQACGTGSVATCCCHAWLAGATGPQRYVVVPTGGIPLGVGFDAQPDGFRAITLSGPATMRFRGEVEVGPEMSELAAP